ncbi:M3 family metallopeptidase [Altererythrobacter sp. CC-YST694]|nr:M3 family metallopeptidase [Altererythrobacter sp. CC-YST694]
MKFRLLAAAAPAILGATALAGLPGTGNAKDTASVTAIPASATAIPRATGYFAQQSTLPFHAPDFTKIRDEDYRSALEQGMKIYLAEVEAIANDPAPASFENTLVAMQKSGRMFMRAYAPFGQMTSANTNDTLDAIDKDMSPKIAALKDAIYLNDKLFQRVKAVYDNRAAMSMTGEDAMLLETTYADFVHAGALLDAKHKEDLKAINTTIAGLETEFSQKLTEATAAKAPIFDSAEELAGLPKAEIDAAAKLATEMGNPGKYALALINTTQQPQLISLTNRATRQKLFEASVNRTSGGGEYDLTGTLAQLAELRAKKAALLSQPNYAAFAMYAGMVKDPAKAISFMEDFVPAVAATQVREGRMLEDMAASEGQNIKLEPWDWAYYAEKVRKARYDIDDATVKPYFDVWKSLEDGVFFAANKFYGINFKRRTDLPTYHPDMRVYTVYDKDGSEMALFYFDPFARPNKQGGAWMGNFVEQSYLLDEKPVVYNTLNIAPPAPGEPALATADDVTTMFHEFGHALHGIFAAQKYPGLSGTNTARDFVEFPSQFNENFAFLPEILNNYAKHYRTGEPIPAELVQKIEAAGKFNQSLSFGELLASALLDMKWHDLTPGAKLNAGNFEKEALGTIALDTRLIPPRYRSPYFRHIWSGGYSAGYYSYIWTEMLAHDAWDWVVKNGGPTRANGEHVRATFLGQGHTKDYADMYRDYAGRDPQIAPMLEARGLSGE